MKSGVSRRNVAKSELQNLEKVNFKSQILVHEYWAILDHFGVPVLFASGCHQHVLKNANITFSGNTGTPEMFQYSPILGRSSIWDLKYTFSQNLIPVIDRIYLSLYLTLLTKVKKHTQNPGQGRNANENKSNDQCRVNTKNTSKIQNTSKIHQKQNQKQKVKRHLF